MRQLSLVLFLVAGLGAAAANAATPQWETLPPTPTLPKAETSGYAPVDGIKIWYAEFGKGEPVILLHGGLGNSSYWGDQVPVLAKHYRVIVMDSRGHGRSTRDGQPFGYDLMSSDVLGLMDFLKIQKAAIIGWSDGGIIGLDIAIHHPERLTKLFAFAANSDPSGVKDIAKSPVFTAYIARAEKEYETLSPTPGQYQSFLDQIGKMWETQPHFTGERTQRHQGPDLDRGCRPRRGDQAREYPLHGGHDPGLGPADPARGQPLLLYPGSRPVQRECPALPGPRSGRVSAGRRGWAGGGTLRARSAPRWGSATSAWSQALGEWRFDGGCHATR